MTRPIENDIVRMSDRWLKDAGMVLDNIAHDTAEVVEVIGTGRPTIARVRWHGENTTWSVLASNLEILDRPGPDTCACGDEEWGACHNEVCYDQYDYERNAI